MKLAAGTSTSFMPIELVIGAGPPVSARGALLCDAESEQEANRKGQFGSLGD